MVVLDPEQGAQAIGQPVTGEDASYLRERRRPG